MKDDNIKYLNTKETNYFHKKEMLFNLYNAYNSIKEKKQVYIVEGPFDVLAYHLAGIDNVVSPLTCKLSDAQLSLLKDNQSQSVSLCLTDFA